MISALDKYLKAKAQKKDKETYEFLLSDPRGRWLLSKLAFENYLYLSTYSENVDIYKKEGARSLVLKMFDEIRGLGKDEIIALMQAEGERHLWIKEQESIFKDKKTKGENIND